MFKLFNAVLVVLPFCIFAHFPEVKNDTCTTRANKPGKCIILAECPHLVNLLKRHPLPEKDKETLQREHCGFVAIHPKVCCALETQIEFSTPSPKVEIKHKEEPSTQLLPNLDTCGTFLEDRIIAGENLQIDAHPWMALLKYETPSGNGFHCGGVLINNRYVLTAAHCVGGKMLANNWKLVGVRLGEYDRDSDVDCDNYLFPVENCCCSDPVVDVGIEKKIIHHDYDPHSRFQYNDIALLRLEENVTFTIYVNPICLEPVSYLSENSLVGQVAEIGGWGVTDLRSNSNKKKRGKVEIKTNEECEKAFSKVGLILRDDQICAFAAAGETTCSADSGGALMNALRLSTTTKNYFPLGIASIAHPICGLAEYPLIFTRVEKFIPWIVSKLKP